MTDVHGVAAGTATAWTGWGLALLAVGIVASLLPLFFNKSPVEKWLAKTKFGSDSYGSWDAEYKALLKALDVATEPAASPDVYTANDLTQPSDVASLSSDEVLNDAMLGGASPADADPTQNPVYMGAGAGGSHTGAGSLSQGNMSVVGAGEGGAGISPETRQKVQQSRQQTVEQRKRVNQLNQKLADKTRQQEASDAKIAELERKLAQRNS